jgi:hypothetical protein
MKKDELVEEVCHAGRVWFTLIITWFPLIVTRGLRQPPNSLEALDTMSGNRGDDDGKQYTRSVTGRQVNPIRLQGA